MEWVLYALLGTQIVLILLALRGLYFVIEIARPDTARYELERIRKLLESRSR